MLILKVERWLQSSWKGSQHEGKHVAVAAEKTNQQQAPVRAQLDSRTAAAAANSMHYPLWYPHDFEINLAK
jgi:hypothetical protein